MLRKEGFEGIIRKGKRLYKVVFRTLDEVKAANEGKGIYLPENTELPDNELDLFDSKE